MTGTCEAALSEERRGEVRSFFHSVRSSFPGCLCWSAAVEPFRVADNATGAEADDRAWLGTDVDQLGRKPRSSRVPPGRQPG